MMTSVICSFTQQRSLLKRKWLCLLLYLTSIKVTSTLQKNLALATNDMRLFNGLVHLFQWKAITCKDQCNHRSNASRAPVMHHASVAGLL